MCLLAVRGLLKWFRRSYAFHADDHVLLAAVLLEEGHEKEINSALAHARIAVDQFENEPKNIQKCRELYEVSRLFSPGGNKK